jgi:hypothetical protein
MFHRIHGLVSFKDIQIGSKGLDFVGMHACDSMKSHSVARLHKQLGQLTNPISSLTLIRMLYPKAKIRQRDDSVFLHINGSCLIQDLRKLTSPIFCPLRSGIEVQDTQVHSALLFADDFVDSNQQPLSCTNPRIQTSKPFGSIHASTSPGSQYKSLPSVGDPPQNGQRWNQTLGLGGGQEIAASVIQPSVSSH